MPSVFDEPKYKATAQSLRLPRGSKIEGHEREREKKGFRPDLISKSQKRSAGALIIVCILNLESEFPIFAIQVFGNGRSVRLYKALEWDVVVCVKQRERKSVLE